MHIHTQDLISTAANNVSNAFGFRMYAYLLFLLSACSHSNIAVLCVFSFLLIVLNSGELWLTHSVLLFEFLLLQRGNTPGMNGSDVAVLEQIANVSYSQSEQKHPEPVVLTVSACRLAVCSDSEPHGENAVDLLRQAGELEFDDARFLLGLRGTFGLPKRETEESAVSAFPLSKATNQRIVQTQD